VSACVRAAPRRRILDSSPTRVFLFSSAPILQRRPPKPPAFLRCQEICVDIEQHVESMRVTFFPPSYEVPPFSPSVTRLLNYLEITVVFPPDSDQVAVLDTEGIFFFLSLIFRILPPGSTHF